MSQVLAEFGVNAIDLVNHRPDRKTNAFDYESEVRAYCRQFDELFVAGNGSRMIAASGREYIDFLAGCGSLNYGHNDPDMKEALIEYIETGGIVQGLDLKTGAKGAFLDAFRKHILEPRGLDYRIQFTGPTGTNAVEAALKLARHATGRSNVVAFTNAFHGVTLGALAATGNKYHRLGAELPLHGVHRAAFDGYFGPSVDTATMLEQMLSDASGGIDAPAAIVLETVQGEGGLNVASIDWLRRIAFLAEQCGALLILDEIQVGCGRAGSFFSFEPAGIVPDVVVLSKSLSGFGLPMAAVLIKPEFDIWKPAEHNGTFRGNNCAFVTARAAIEKFWRDDSFTSKINDDALWLANQLEEIAAGIPGSKRKGRGMLQGIEVGSASLAESIRAKAFQDGLVVETAGPRDDVLKILAPHSTPRSDLALGMGILRGAIEHAMVRPQVA